MNLRRCCAMSIHHPRCGSMSRHCCCALPILSMSRETRCVARADCIEVHCAGPADCISAHCVGPGDCNGARSAARAMNCPAALAASQWADADQAEACCFRQSCLAEHGQHGLPQKFQDRNHDLPLNCDPGLDRDLRSNRDRRWTGISASHRFPACASSVRRCDQRIATSRN